MRTSRMCVCSQRAFLRPIPLEYYYYSPQSITIDYYSFQRDLRFTDISSGTRATFLARFLPVERVKIFVPRVATFVHGRVSRSVNTRRAKTRHTVIVHHTAVDPFRIDTTRVLNNTR